MLRFLGPRAKVARFRGDTTQAVISVERSVPRPSRQLAKDARPAARQRGTTELQTPWLNDGRPSLYALRF